MAHLHQSVASLRIIGDELDPAQMTTLLGCQPTLSYSKGQTINPKRSTAVRHAGMWLLEASVRQPEDLNGQVAEILGQLPQSIDFWRDLSANYRLELFVGLFMEEADEGVEMSSDTLLALGQRGIALGACIYAPTKDEL